MIRYIDATDSPDERVDYPEIVDELVALGFAQIGRVIGEPINGTFEDLAADYDPSAARAFLDHCDVPATVLRSPDGTTFVEVSWFWESPSVRMRSVLDDDAVAETQRKWTFRPGLPLALEDFWTNFDIDADMMKRHTPHSGRSTLVVETTSVAEQWRRHQDHITAYAQQRGATPMEHVDLPQHIDLSYRLFAHDMAVEKRVTSLWKPLVLSYGAIGIIAMLALFFGGYPLFGIGLGVVLAVLTMPVVGLVIGKVRILPVRMRPRFL